MYRIRQLAEPVTNRFVRNLQRIGTKGRLSIRPIITRKSDDEPCERNRIENSSAENSRKRKKYIKKPPHEAVF